MKKNRLKIIAIFIGIIGALILFSGVSLATLSRKEIGALFSKIKNDSISFNYQEGTNELNLKEGLPMSDEDGIEQDDYFEFSVKANPLKNVELPYSITAKQFSNSADVGDVIKIGLTEVVPAYNEAISYLDVTKTKCDKFYAQAFGINDVEYKCGLKYKAGDSATDIYALAYFYDSPYDTLEMCQQDSMKIAAAAMASFAKCEEKEDKYYIKIYVGDYNTKAQCMESMHYEDGDECVLKYADKEQFTEDIYELTITYDLHSSYATCLASKAMMSYSDTNYPGLKIKNDNVDCIKTDELTEETIIIDTYNNLTNYDESSLTEKNIYSTFANYQNYNKTYRLRMWVDENIDVTNSKYHDSSFGIIINVYSKGNIIDLPGLYDVNNRLLASWDDLINKYGLDIEQDYTDDDYIMPDYSFFDTEEKMNDYIANPYKYFIYKSESSLGYIMQHNEELSSGSKLIIGNVDKIGNRALEVVPLREIVISPNISSIGISALANNTNLTNIKFKHSTKLSDIGKNAFTGSNITNIEIPASVELIGANAFAGCNNLKEVTFEKNSRLKIMESTFLNSGLESIEIPSSVETIGAWAFNSCQNLKTLTFEKNSRLKTIEENVFLLAGLNTITIPSTVTNIGENAFLNIPHVYYTGNATGSPWGAKAIN